VPCCRHALTSSWASIPQYAFAKRILCDHRRPNAVWQRRCELEIWFSLRSTFWAASICSEASSLAVHALLNGPDGHENAAKRNTPRQPPVNAVPAGTQRRFPIVDHQPTPHVHPNTQRTVTTEGGRTGAKQKQPRTVINEGGRTGAKQKQPRTIIREGERDHNRRDQRKTTRITATS